MAVVVVVPESTTFWIGKRPGPIEHGAAVDRRSSIIVGDRFVSCAAVDATVVDELIAVGTTVPGKV